MTLSRAISEWVRELRATGKAAQTVAAYESDLRRMSKHATLDTVLHVRQSRADKGRGGGAAPRNSPEGE